jgi:hypothetical protein
MIKADKRGDPHVLDLKFDRYLPYDPDNPSQAVEALVCTIKATLDNEKLDSPVFQLLPGLPSFDAGKFDAGKVVVVLLKFREQVEQAASMLEALVTEAHERAFGCRAANTQVRSFNNAS